MPLGSPERCGPRRAISLLLAAAGITACGGGGSGGSSPGVVGEEIQKPGGGTFFVDPNQGGQATRLHLSEMFWARLADVHDVDGNGQPSAQPLFRDFAINENIQSDGANYKLTTNPITQKTRLVIRRQRDADDTGTGTFSSLLRNATQGLAPVLPKNDDGTSSEPFSFVARNATLVLRLDDALTDGTEEARELASVVHVLTGYRPTTPLATRILFDPNHGALIGSTFHTTRILIDLTVSEAEAAASPVPLELNSLGLPASLITTSQPNVSIRIPTRLDPGSGQFTLLRGLSGAPLAFAENGPADGSSPALDIVRALRAGNGNDGNNGFLLDLNAPAIAGGWPSALENARPDPAGLAGFDFLVDLRFTTPCRSAPVVGDICSVGGLFLEVQSPGSPPGGNGLVGDLRVRSLRDEPIDSASSLLGSGLFLSVYDGDKPVPTGCWITFTPLPASLPQAHVSPDAQALIRFTEPMDPASISPFETFFLVRGGPEVQPAADKIVVANVVGSPDLKNFTFTPLLPLAHAQLEDPYHFEFGAFTDLAGNRLTGTPQNITFTVDPLAPRHSNSGLVLRFGSDDEVAPTGLRDLRGQFFYDLSLGTIRPRAVSFLSAAADRTNPVPSIMIPFPPGVQTPLSPLGSKLQALWRYADLGWSVRDETKYNLDVVGLSWAPIAGQVISDFFEGFEIRLSHTRFLPDECLATSLLPNYPNSGLLGSPNFFTDNILNDPRSPQKIVHPRPLGYLVNPANLFRGISGRLLMPYPLNRGGGPLVTFTWRDTAALTKAGPRGKGIPMCIEAGRPLFLETTAGSVAPAGSVPTFGLPLLMEYRCYPSDSGVGLNPLDVSLAINSSPQPNFRAYSTGGINRFGVQVLVDPDLELVPSGGYNPTSNPPGKKTAFDAENTFYIGQLDYVVRVSRVHSMWFDTADGSPDYIRPIVVPSTSAQPLGTDVVLDYRGAGSFQAAAGTTPFDAGALDAYGDLPDDPVNYFNDVRTWSSDLDTLDGARYFQLRISFLSNIETGLSPLITAIGIPFSFD